MNQSTELRVSFGEVAHKPDLTKIQPIDLVPDRNPKTEKFKNLFSMDRLGIVLGGITLLSMVFLARKPIADRNLRFQTKTT